jgi:hypothetical protein
VGQQLHELPESFRRLQNLLHEQRLHHLARSLRIRRRSQKAPLSAEWKDANGKLIYAAYYEYVFDSHGNWVRREVWIISPSHPNRTFYETDIRTITYWSR